MRLSDRAHIFALAGLGAALLAGPAATVAGTISGSSNGLTWTATDYIIGQTSTATQAPPTPPGTVGNPIYWAHSPAPGYDNSKYSGVVALILNEGAAGNFICSGSLLADRIHVLTAGHCVSSGNSVITTQSATATFYHGTDPEAVIGTTGTPAAGAVQINIAAESVNPLYTGNVIDDHDVAVLTLAQQAPDWATGYQIYTTGDLVGQDYNVAGYGRRSDQGGSVGADLGTGRLRQGDNRYDFVLGDSAFGGVLNSDFFGETGDTTANSYIADFDNGSTAQDGSCGLYEAFGNAPDYATGGKFCNLGRGATEVSTAPGDSGGPEFVNGQIASVTSYGLSFGQNLQPGDIDNTLNDTFGEFNGFASTRFNSSYIDSIADIPEPATWAMMVAGFGLVGAVARRRGTVAAA